jgi:hypothetical protein
MVKTIVALLVVASVFGSVSCVRRCPVEGIGGWGSTGPDAQDLTLVAARVPNAPAFGHSHLHGGATGTVAEIVPQSSGQDYWCVNVKRTDTGTPAEDQRINWFIRDVGDGVSTFDQISYITGMAITCTSQPKPTGAWLTLKQGDYKTY